MRLIESRLSNFFLRFNFVFVSLTRNVVATAFVYLKGLLLCHRRNCQVMCEELQQSNNQRLHHFIANAKWQYQQLMDEVTLLFWQMIQSVGLAEDTCLIIDDSGIPKKGSHSAGVKRQYCGQLGKTDNCQVGVFGALCAGSLVNLVQSSLFMAKQEFSKIDQGNAIINHVIKELKIKVKWVCFDSFYGRDLRLLAGLIKSGIDFVADVPDNLQIWLEPFQMRIPSKKEGVRGRSYTKARPNQQSISLKNYTASLAPLEWKYIRVRHQSGGKKLQAWFHARDVYIINPLTNKRQLITLLVREDKDGTIKHSFCHCPKASIQELAYRQSKRYFVEMSFREAKKELGLNEYQTRSEQSWHKHMAMVMLAQLFLNEEKIKLFEQEKLWMTTQDVILILKSVLTFIKRSTENLLDYILLKQPPDKRLITKKIFLRI